MQKNVKVSIIVPAYNVQTYIGECIESLVNQTYRNIEIVIVNDGSTDNTLEVIENYAKKDNRIIVLNQKNKGVSASRNEALKLVSGDFTMFCDSDDWYDLDAVEFALNSIVEENADVAMFGYIREYGSNSIPKAMFDDNKIIFNNIEVKSKLQRRIFGPIGEETATPEKLNAITTIWSKIYKTELIRNVRFENLNEVGLCEDGIFNIDVFGKANKVVFIKKHIYHYRKVVAGGSLTQKKDDDFFEREKRFYNKLNDIILKEKLNNDYSKALNNRMVISIIEVGIRFSNNKKTTYKNLKNVLKSDIYRNSIKNFELRFLPFHWKVFFYSAKKKFAFGVYLLFKAIVLLMSKK